ncbi:MAG: hypothetical protein RL292_373, partial [Candidatus Parcubacteria bacterium]
DFKLGDIEWLAKNRASGFLFSVGERGLEPPLLAEPVPKTGVATITPLAQYLLSPVHFSFF